MISPGMGSLVDELSDVLDEGIELLALRRSQLAELSEALVSRDDEAAEGLLDQIRQADKAQVSVDLRLKAVREALARALGCGARELKLDRLIAELPKAQALALDYRRRRILDGTEEQRAQHVQTALLLAECARINRTLLDGVLSGGGTVVTYGADGTRLWRPERGLVDTEL